MTDPSGQRIGCLVLLRDVTGRHCADAEREALIVRLRQAMDQVRTLTGLLPICSGCKKIRDEAGTWQQVDTYILRNTTAQLTHGLCPECARRLFPD